MNELPQKIEISKDVLVQDLTDTAVILNLETEHYYGLDHVGRRIWQLLSENSDVQAIYNTILQEYDVQPAQLTNDMLKLLNGLLEANLIIVNEPS